jgi:zinc protease
MIRVVLVLGIFCAEPADTAQITRLENGLRVVVLPDSRWRSVSVQMWYRVGSADDPAGQRGAVDLSRRVLAAESKTESSGEFESFTLPDACGFAWLVRGEELKVALEAEARRAEAREVSSERLAAVRAEDRLRQQEQQCSCQEAIAAVVFAGHPYAQAFAPPPEAANVGVEAVNELIRRSFKPANATLLVTGDVPVAETMELVRRHFGSLPAGQVANPGRRAVGAGGPVVLEPMASRCAGLTVGWVVGPAGGDDQPALAVLMHALCNPVDGLLCGEVLAAGGMPPRWKMLLGRDAGLLLLNVDVAGSATNPSDGKQPGARLQAIVEKCMQMAATRPLTELALVRARALAARDLLLVRADLRSWSHHLAWLEVVAGDIGWADWELAAVEAVGAADVQRAATQLRSSRCAVVPRVVGTRRPEVPCTGKQTKDSGPIVRGSCEGTLDGRAPYRIDCTKGLEIAEVTTAVTPEELVRGLACLLGVGSQAHPVEQLRDYLSYRGIDLFVVAGGGLAALRSRGPASAVPQMIELHAELLRQPGRDPRLIEAAAQNGRRLKDWLAAGWRPDSECEWYLPPGFVGWQLGFDVPTDGAEIARSLEALGECTRVEVSIRGDVELTAAEQIIRDFWGPGSAATQPARP